MVYNIIQYEKYNVIWYYMVLYCIIKPFIIQYKKQYNKIKYNKI